MPCCSRLKKLSSDTDNTWSWILCVLAAFSNALHFGISLSFGVFLPFLLDHFKESIDKTATAGSLAIAITFVATLPAAKLIDYLGLRAVSLAGSLICGVGLLLTSLAKNIIVIYITYSLAFGIGSSFLYTSSMFVSRKHFKKRRAIAVGVICAGGGSGFLVLGPLLQLCLEAFGLERSCRIMATIFILPGLISLFYSSADAKTTTEAGEKQENSEENPLRKVHTRKNIIDWSIWKNPNYTVNTASLTLAGLTHYIPQLYLVENCETLGISPVKSSQLLIFIGLATLFSRTIIGILLNSPNISSTFVFQSSQLLNALVHLTIPFASKYEHFVITSVLYGCADGAFVTTLNHILLTSVRKPEQVSSAFGYGCIGNSMTTAAGAPLAGLLIKHYDSYTPAFLAGAGVLFISSMIPAVYWSCVWTASRCRRQSRKNLEPAKANLCPKYLQHSETSTDKPLPANSHRTTPPFQTVQIFESP